MTETRTATLAEFLLARIAEDEAAARAATPGPWRWATYTPREHYARNALVGAAGTVLLAEASDHEGSYIDASEADAAHIACWDPARVLAECQAKRALIDWHHKIPLPYERDQFLRLLALAYVEHPDYRQEWRV